MSGRHQVVHSCCTRAANELAYSFLHQQHLECPCAMGQTGSGCVAIQLHCSNQICTALSVVASVGRQRKMLQTTKATPCMHGHAVQTVGTTSSSSSSAESPQAAPVAAHFNRQLFQAPAPPRRRRPPPVLTPQDRTGFATARAPLPPAQVQRQRSRPVSI